MKFLRAVLAVLAVLATACVPLANAAQTAQARLHCWSLQFQRATAADSTGWRWQLDLTTLQAGVNGELAPDFFESDYTHSTYVDLWYEWEDEIYPGAMVLDVPFAGDANGNGLDDFFEVSQPVYGLASSGGIQCDPYFPFDDISVLWYREAGSHTGVCVITLPDPWSPTGTLNFFHSFELIEYEGALAYTPGWRVVNATLAVTNSHTGDVLLGPLVFDKSATDPANQLLLADAALTNALLQPLSLYTNTWFLRDNVRPTNYYGNLEFVDGNPDTPASDYYLWHLSFDDPNDSNGNGIPDFSDTPRQPLLSVAEGAGQLLLTLRGDVGWTNRIQAITNLASTNWQTVLTVKQTNDPQTLTLPLPSGPTFWRSQIVLP
jgi:hypothetical protein